MLKFQNCNNLKQFNSLHCHFSLNKMPRKQCESYNKNSSQSSEYGYGSSNQRRNVQQKQESEYLEQRFLMPRLHAEHIIGPNGNNIKRLHMEYCAMINISDTKTSERILTIGGFDLSTMCSTLEDIIARLQMSLENDQYSDSSEPCIGMLLDMSQVDYITSFDEYKLNNILEETGTHIDVFLMCCPQSSDRVIRIKGQPQSIAQCVFSFYEILQWCNTQRSRNPYNADNANEVYAADYGGYTSEVVEPEPTPGQIPDEDMDISYEDGELLEDEAAGPSTAPPMTPPMAPTMTPPIAPTMVSTMAPTMSSTTTPTMAPVTAPSFSTTVPTMAPNMVPTTAPTVAPADAMKTETETPMPENSTSSLSTVTVSIQATLVGVILGKAGSRLKQICDESNAAIHLNDEDSKSSNRTIRISGSAEEVDNAKELLRMCIRYFCVRLQ